MKKWILAIALLATNAMAYEVHQENAATGVYIIDGDIPLLHPSQKFDFIQSNEDKLIVDTVDGVYDIWNKFDRMNLTYCVSDEFGKNKAATVAAFKQATKDWMEAANVRFEYVASEDDNCTTSNNNVMFNVAPAFGERYLARAFFPNYPREYRDVLVNDDSYEYNAKALAGFIRHELGHVLGFRHEHISKDSERVCDEDENFKPLTKYDSASVMHYPQCGGTGNIMNLAITEFDKEGAQVVYPF
ncbi:matrixin [Bacteriovorax sp. BSW11_IV]|uniref:M57 family metalloprotease n=1 Tax=Bacteriovorax sp. BSW11_IV TaxID=1353529 RepID=UPI00038A4825|nr:M57 family metalloprotease [Bacteriovorax sp. BSW11_IV]EQC45199.1 matrixin [Bacteriovorax sp. BSW11_IV]